MEKINLEKNTTENFGFINQGGSKMNAYEKEKSESEYIDYLNEIYGEVKICGMAFDSGYVLKELDPIAFHCGLSDMPILWACGECDKVYEDDQESAEECCKE